MKTTVLWVFRHLVLTAGFIFATGLPQKISKIEHLPIKDAYNTFTREELSTLYITPGNFMRVTDSLIALRRNEVEKVGYYDVHHYFADLKQINMFHEVYRDSFRARGIYMESNFRMNELTNIRDTYGRLANKGPKEQRDAIDANWTKTDEAREYWFPLAKVEREAREKDPFKWGEDFLFPTFYWLWKFYLRGFPIAFILFLIWKFQVRKEFEEEVYHETEKLGVRFGSAPASFVLSVVFWPIILGIDIYNRKNEYLRKAEVLSRRNTLLGLFSKQEEKLLEIGKKMSRVEFGEYLDSIGMRRKHSFALALVATLFILVIPRSVFPATGEVHHDQQTIVVSIDYGGDHVNGNHNDIVTLDALVPEPQGFGKVFLNYVFYFPDQICNILEGFLSDTGGVPKVAINFARI